MNNSEIHEIKKRLKFCDEASFKIETCYVIGSEKRIRSRMNTYLTNLDEGDRHKYIEILKKGLSGVLNRNLLNLSFKRGMDGEDAQKFLLSLRDSERRNRRILTGRVGRRFQIFLYMYLPRKSGQSSSFIPWRGECFRSENTWLGCWDAWCGISFPGI